VGEREHLLEVRRPGETRQGLKAADDVGGRPSLARLGCKLEVEKKRCQLVAEIGDRLGETRACWASSIGAGRLVFYLCLFYLFIYLTCIFRKKIWNFKKVLNT
jgi:hypothetical protein